MGKTALFSRVQPGGVFSIYDETRTTGNIYFVNSVGGVNSVGAGQNPDAPFATINYAITQCTASQGDRIYVMPGHAESLSGAAAIAANIAGVAIIGMGQGPSRPTITLHTTDATIAVSAAGVSFQNIVIKCDVDEIVTCFNVTAAFCTLDAVDFVETASMQLICFLLTSAAGTDLTIKNCKHQQATAAAANSLWITLIGADRARILNNEFFLTTTNSASSSVINSKTTAPVGILIRDNVIVQLGGTGTIPINLVTSTSGFVLNNTVASAKTAIAGSIALASCYGANNYASHVVNKNGLLEPVVDT